MEYIFLRFNIIFSKFTENAKSISSSGSPKQATISSKRLQPSTPHLPSALPANTLTTSLSSSARLALWATIPMAAVHSACLVPHTHTRSSPDRTRFTTAACAFPGIASMARVQCCNCRRHAAVTVDMQGQPVIRVCWLLLLGLQWEGLF